MHGSIRRNDEGFWVAEIEGRLTADGGSEDEQAFPDSMVGVARGGTFYLSDRRRWKDLRPGMGQSLHIVQLFYETIVTRVDLNSVEADGIVEAEVIFPNQYVWAHYERPEWRRRSADDPLGKGVSLDFAPVEETKVDLHDGFTLTVKPTWWFDWDIEQLTIGAGLSLALSSADPVPTARYVRNFEQMQDLIGLCWSGRVIPLPGAGRVNHSVEDAGTFFSQPFFDPHHGNLADLSTPFPAVYLPDLGGPPAFARWLELCRDYRRATRGVSEGLYVGASAETRLLNTVTAISYWVGSHRRTQAWTAVKHPERGGRRPPPGRPHAPKVRVMVWRRRSVQCSPLVGLQPAEARPCSCDRLHARERVHFGSPTPAHRRPAGHRHRHNETEQNASPTTTGSSETACRRSCRTLSVAG
jgi:hypothetical protein